MSGRRTTPCVMLVASYIAGFPVMLVLGVIGALLGVGEGVRSQVAPMSKVVEHVDDVAF